MTDTATAIPSTSSTSNTAATTCTRSPIATPESTDIERPLEAPIVNREASSSRVLVQPTAPTAPRAPGRTAPAAQPVLRRLMWSLADILQLSPTPSQHALSQVGGADRSPRG